jgi:hypothetical protein
MAELVHQVCPSCSPVVDPIHSFVRDHPLVVVGGLAIYQGTKRLVKLYRAWAAAPQAHGSTRVPAVICESFPPRIYFENEHDQRGGRLR